MAGKRANVRKRRVPTGPIANQIFIGCPWKTVRPKYITITERFSKKYPVSFIIVGKEKEHSAEDLLGLIKGKLESSSGAIFDVSGGNANVSLEFGYAEAMGVQSALYLNTHQMGTRRGGGAAIISDLAGKRRREYKNEARLSELLGEYTKNHPFTLRFEQALRRSLKSASKGAKKRTRALTLKIIHYLDDKISVRRSDLTNHILALHNGYKAKEVEQGLKMLHKEGLIKVSEGRYSDVYIFSE
ncbi:MAG: hypothetical protein WDN01_18980 [Rhizomicrobium sp.]